MRRILIVLLLVLTPAPAAGARDFVFSGHGWGHGVGMSQWGAEGLARHGWSYGQILAHYYPGTRLVRTPNRPVRVLLVEERSRVGVGSADGFRLTDASGRSWRLPARRLVLTPGLTPRLHGKRVHLRAPLRVEPDGLSLTLDGSAYRGSFEIFRAGQGFDVVNHVPLEGYVRGVVPWEMPHGWSGPAYAAQAVAARSYALTVSHPGQRFDLFADTRDQVYGGIGAEQGWTDRATALTSGLVLTWHGRVARAYYSSTSGGRTQALGDAGLGAAPVPYLVSVADPYDAISPHHRWGPMRFGAARLARLLHVPSVARLQPVLNASGRVAAVVASWPGGSARLGGRDVQARLSLPSTWFRIRGERAGGRVAALPPLGKPAPVAPPRLHGWIAVLQSSPAAGERPRAQRGTRVLRSSDYPGLRPGFYVLAAGPFGSRAQAESAAGELRGRFPEAYPRRI